MRDALLRRLVLAAALYATQGVALAAPYGFGQPATDAAIAAWNIDIDANGRGLPPGRGSVAHGQAVYAQKCAACHGANGEGKPADALVGGTGSLTAAKAVKTVGSFWPYATTLYDFIYRAMPYTAPQSLPRVQMPNQAGFVQDSRPDTSNTACERCR